MSRRMGTDEADARSGPEEPAMGVPEHVSEEDIPPVSAESLVKGEVTEDEPPVPPVPLDGRRYPSTIGGACYLLILLITVVGLGIILRGDWRFGVRVIGGSLIAAGTLRLLLPSKDAGMLAVRNRFLDVGLLAVVGGLIIFLANDIPDQP